MKRTFENCSVRIAVTGPNRVFNDTELNNKGQCKGFELPYGNTFSICKKCELWEGNNG